MSRTRLFFFSLPQAPLLALSLALIVFLPPHFATELAMPLAQVSALFFAVRLIDVLAGPFLGQAEDLTRTRLGRRRPWLAAAALPTAFLTWLAFAGLQTPVSWLIAAPIVLALYLSFSATMIAHMSWAGEVRPDYHGRTLVLGALQGAGAAGQLAMLMLAAYAVLGQANSGEPAVRAMGWAVAFAIPLTVILAVFAAPEPRSPAPFLKLGEALRALGANAPLRTVLAASLVLGAAQGVSGGLFVFFFQYRLGFASAAHFLLLLYFAGGLAGVPLWIWLGRRLGKHRALQLACVLSAVATACVLVLPTGVLAAAAPAMAAAGVNVGAGVLLIRAMMADIVDEDELATGGRRSGLLFGLLLTASKIGIALGPLSYAALALFGFDVGLGARNSSTAMMALDAMFIGAPVLIYLAVALMLRRFPLDETRQQALRAMIEKRRLARGEVTRNG
jgi:glycoside/pentoside/hexuronide:cation symporter, GPH family